MNFEKWISRNTTRLDGKRVAVTGSTGGIGRELCGMLASLCAELILVDRNLGRSRVLGDSLGLKYGAKISYVSADLSDMASVKKAAEELILLEPDVFIHNAGAYDIPRYKTDIGYDNVFQINFISPYVIIKKLLPILRERGGRVVVVGSIAHNYSKTDANDVDFSTRKAASRVYGNAKRYLMFSLGELFASEAKVSLAVTHPGISFTGITNHYPKLVFALIKHPMKVIFMKPKKASLSVLRGVFESTGECEWIGPRIFNVWGLPKKMKLKTATKEEREMIFRTAESIYSAL